MTEATKKCNDCKIQKPLSEFYLFKYKRKPWAHSRYCKPCDNARSRLWKKNNPDKIRKGARETHHRKTYNIEPLWYATMLREQEFVCAICKTLGKPTGNGQRTGLHVDHDHGSGKIRGLLCGQCNMGLGLFKDDCHLLQQAIKYLEANRI